MRDRRVVLAVSVLDQSCYAAIFFGLPVLAPFLQTRYDLSLPQVGVVISAPESGSLLTVLAWGMLADRFGERNVLASGLGLAGIALGAAAYAHDYVALVVSLIAAGMFAACVLTASGRVVIGAFPPNKRGLALAMRQTAPLLVGAIGSVALPQLVGVGGTRAALLGIAILALAAAATSAILLSTTENCSAQTAGGDNSRHPFRDRRIWRLSGGSALLIVPQTFVIAFLILFLHQHRGLSVTAAAAVLAVVQVLGAAIRLASGRWSDRNGFRVLLLVRLAAASGVAFALAAVLVHAPLGILLPVVVAAAALSLGWNPLSFTATAELARVDRAGSALGLQQTAVSLGTFVSPVAFALLVAATGWAVGFAAAAMGTLAGVIALWQLRSVHAWRS
jgi:MFS family permease